MSETIKPTDGQNNIGIDTEATAKLYQTVIDMFANRATIYDILADATRDGKKRGEFVNEAIQNASDAELLREEARKRGLAIIEPEE